MRPRSESSSRHGQSRGNRSGVYRGDWPTRGEAHSAGRHREDRNLETQILWAGNWIPLPVNGETLSVFPSAKISSLSEISATPHRVLLWEPWDSESAAGQNITLSLSIVDRPACSDIGPHLVIS